MTELKQFIRAALAAEFRLAAAMMRAGLHGESETQATLQRIEALLTLDDQF